MGQLLDVPFKFYKLGLGYVNGTQKNDQSPRSGGLMSHFISQGVNAIEDDGVILNHIIQQYPNEIPPGSEEVWDTLGELSGGYDFLVKYTAPQSYFIAMEDIAPTGWGDQFEDDKSFTSPITEQYQNPPKRVWDTLGEPSGKYDFMVKYSAPPSSQVAIEDIVPTGWDEHCKDNFTPDEAWEIPNNEGYFLS